MKKVSALVLERSDLKEGFTDMTFNEVNPYVFKDEVTEIFYKFPLIIFVNSESPLAKTRVMQNSFGVYGSVQRLNCLEK